MTDSFVGGVHPKGDGRGTLRARVALVGAHVEALTGTETFRIPLVRCEVASEGQRVVVRNLEGTLEIWSDEPPFLDVLERGRRGALKGQVGAIRNARVRRRVLVAAAKVLVAATLLIALSGPAMRWAVGGGVPSVVDNIGREALLRLNLPAAKEPLVEKHLAVIAAQLQTSTTLPKTTLRVVLAGYHDVHSFHLPPDVLVVTAALVCQADDSLVVTAALARELAHLEAHDMNAQLAAIVDTQTALNMLAGDSTKLLEYMLDYADSRRTPGYTSDQDDAADKRALDVLHTIAGPTYATKDLELLVARARDPQHEPDESNAPLPAAPAPTAPSPATPSKDAADDWAAARARACELLGQ